MSTSSHEFIVTVANSPYAWVRRRRIMELSEDEKVGSRDDCMGGIQNGCEIPSVSLPSTVHQDRMSTYAEGGET